MIKMSGVLRSLKLHLRHDFMNVFRKPITLESTKQRLQSMLEITSMKSTEDNDLKSTALSNKICSTISKQPATRSKTHFLEFLEEEIKRECKFQIPDTIPPKIDEFEVKLDGSEVTLVKSSPIETVTIEFNISTMTNITPFLPEIKGFICQLPFFIEVKKGDTTLLFACSEESYPQENEEIAGDFFHINKISLYKGERKETKYEIIRDGMNGYLYKEFMNFLDEKGVSKEFCYKMSKFATVYERSNHISLLRELKNFSSK